MSGQQEQDGSSAMCTAMLDICCRTTADKDLVGELNLAYKSSETPVQQPSDSVHIRTAPGNTSLPGCSAHAENKSNQDKDRKCVQICREVKTTEEISIKDASTQDISSKKASTEEKISTKKASTEEKISAKKASTEEKISTKEASTEEKIRTTKSCTEEISTKEASTEVISTKEVNAKKISWSTMEFSTEKNGNACDGLEVIHL